MSPALEGLEDVQAGLRFRFGNATSGPQTGVHVDHRSAPELVALFGLRRQYGRKATLGEKAY